MTGTPKRDDLRVEDCVFCDGHGKVLGNDVQQFETRRVVAILQEVAAAHELQVGDVIGQSRSPFFVWARDEAAFRMRSEIGLEYKTIGWYLGKRDHSTIITSVRRHEARMQEA